MWSNCALTLLSTSSLACHQLSRRLCSHDDDRSYGRTLGPFARAVRRRRRPRVGQDAELASRVEQDRSLSLTSRLIETVPDAARSLPATPAFGGQGRS